MIRDPMEGALLAAKVASNKKARDVVVLEMKPLTPVTDYFVICSGATQIQVRAIADEIEEKLKEQGVRLLHREGYNNGRWVLLDYGGFVVHVFHERERAFYDLERLWGDAQVVASGGPLDF